MIECEKKYSVLMSVYIKERAENLREAMESIFAQSIMTDDFVLICDGPLTEELNQVIYEMQEQHPSVLHVIRLKDNLGLGKALNYGLKQCKNDLVARMDSDDISRQERCEKQLKIFTENEDISVVSGTVEEFETTPDEVTVQRILPETNAEIIKFAQKRNPFNHPCVMYRKSAVEKAGGYLDFLFLEDYFLWIRMLNNGSKGYNLREPLLWMRAGNEMYMRRSGRKYAKSQRKLFHYMQEINFISRRQQIMSSLLRTISSLLPNRIRKVLFEKILRKKAGISVCRVIQKE